MTTADSDELLELWTRIGDAGEFYTQLTEDDGVYALEERRDEDGDWTVTAEGPHAYIFGYLHGRIDGEGIK